MTSRSGQQLVDLAAAVPFWWHSIDLGEGVVSPGWKSAEHLAGEWSALRLPDLAGRTVLDVGAWDGWFSFEAEGAGAERVVALDHYVWSLDLGRQQAYWNDCKARGVVPRPYHEVPELWQPDRLPGKQGFDTAARARSSRVEAVVADFMAADLDALGAFDVVLYLGVLYHMTSPLEALRRLAQVTSGLAVIETEAIVVSGRENHALCEFFESNELAGDVSNWWAPNAKALLGMCRAAGFARADLVSPTPAASPEEGLSRYRAVVHARRAGLD